MSCALCDSSDPRHGSRLHRAECRGQRLGELQLDAGVLDLPARGVEVEDLVEARKESARRLANAEKRVGVARKQHELAARTATHYAKKSSVGGSTRTKMLNHRVHVDVLHWLSRNLSIIASNAASDPCHASDPFVIKRLFGDADTYKYAILQLYFEF
ncbi:MAG: hypothetical protein U1A78_39125 [Polyangia bacterium]